MGKFKELFTKAQERRMDETGCSLEEATEWIEQQSVGFLIDYTDTWEKVNEEEKPWPKFSNTYYVVTGAGHVGAHIFTGDICDEAYKNIGNMFRTKEEAEFEIERLKVIAELRSLADDDQPWDGICGHWSMTYDCHDHKITSMQHFRSRDMKIYFKSEESIITAIKKVGGDRIKKYLVGVEE